MMLLVGGSMDGWMAKWCVLYCGEGVFKGK